MQVGRPEFEPSHHIAPLPISPMQAVRKRLSLIARRPSDNQAEASLLDIRAVRASFPSLADGYIFADNAGGSQCLKAVVDRISDYLLNTNVQLGVSTIRIQPLISRLIRLDLNIC